MPGETEKSDHEKGLLGRLEGSRRSRGDSWANFGTGTGVRGVDKRLGARPRVRRLSYNECADLYRGNGMAARAVNCIPDECARKGFSVAVAGDPDVAESFDRYSRTLRVIKNFKQAHRFARAYGGGALFVGANDGQLASLPLNEDKIKSIDFLIPLDTQEIVPTAFDWSAGPNFGLPISYRLNRFGSMASAYSMISGLEQIATGVFENSINRTPLPDVHHSRIIRFDGIFTNRIQQREQRYWGDPIFNRMESVIRDFDLTWDSAAQLIADFAQAIVKMKGLSSLIASQGRSILTELAQTIDQSRSSGRMLLLDSEDEFERSPTPITGLADILDRFSKRLAAEIPMPVTRLMGEAPAGLSATGEQDADWWIQVIDADHLDIWEPAADRLSQLMFLAKDGPTKGKLPKNWSTKFKPLSEIGPEEEAKRRYAIGQTDDLAIKNGQVTPEEVAITRYGGDEYNDGKIQLLETDPEKRAAMAQELAEEKASAGQGEGSGEGSGDGEGTGDNEPEDDGTGG